MYNVSKLFLCAYYYILFFLLIWIFTRNWLNFGFSQIFDLFIEVNYLTTKILLEIFLLTQIGKIRHRCYRYWVSRWGFVVQHGRHRRIRNFHFLQQELHRKVLGRHRSVHRILMTWRTKSYQNHLCFRKMCYHRRSFCYQMMSLHGEPTRNYRFLQNLVHGQEVNKCYPTLQQSKPLLDTRR